MNAGPGAVLGWPRRRVRTDGHDEPHADHGDQVDRPVLGVEQRRRHEGDRDQVARPRRSTARCKARNPSPVRRMTSAYMRDSVA